MQVAVLQAASQPSGHFPGCPAGGTHPLNAGYHFAIEILLHQGKGFFMTHQPFYLDFSHPWILGANLREFTKLYFSSQFIVALPRKELLEMITQKPLPQTKCPEHPSCLLQRNPRFCWSLMREACTALSGGLLHCRVRLPCLSGGPGELGGEPREAVCWVFK